MLMHVLWRFRRRCEVSVLLSSLLCLRGMQFLICHMSHMESGPLPCLCRGSRWRSDSSAPRAEVSRLEACAGLRGIFCFHIQLDVLLVFWGYGGGLAM